MRGAGRVAKPIDERKTFDAEPKRTKFRKQFKGRIHGLAKGGRSSISASFGLKALEPVRVTARQIEAARRAITRHIKRAGRVWIRVFPDVPVTKKPAEVRMGKGKGAPEFWVPGQARPHHVRDRRRAGQDLPSEAMRLAAAKLPIQTKFIAPHCRRGGERYEGRRDLAPRPPTSCNEQRASSRQSFQPAHPAASGQLENPAECAQSAARLRASTPSCCERRPSRS